MGELEARIMDILWASGGWMTPREVQSVLAEETDLAYTTVMTVLSRLWKKGMLERQRDGLAYAYHPVESKEEWTARRMVEMLSHGGNRSKALSLFVDSMSESERHQLRRLLRAMGAGRSEGDSAG